MITHLNVNKQKYNTTRGRHIFRDCLFKAKTGRYAEFSFQETKSLSSYAGLLGVNPLATSHTVEHLSSICLRRSNDKPILYLIFHCLKIIDIAWNS